MNRYRLFFWMVILAFSAGIINAVFVFGCDGMTVSHVTGLISRFAISVASGELTGCLDVLFVILAFFAGAVVAGIVTGQRAFHMEKVYGFLVISIGIIALIPLFIDMKFNMMLFAFIMGLQNGMIVTFRDILIRSTHMTGNLTDLGVYIGYKIRGNKEERPANGMVPFGTIIGFIIGGIAGVLLYKAVGKYVFAVVSGIYILLGCAYFYLQKTCIDKNFNGAPDDTER